MRRKLVEDKDITSWFHTLTCGIEFFPGAGAGDTGVRICRASNFAALSLWGIPPPGAGSSFFMSIQSVLRVAQVKDFMKQDQGGSPRLVLPARPSFKGGRGAIRIPAAVRRHVIG
jgi:hypothetical protein